MNVVMIWRIPDSAIVTYRSFRPFLPLLNCYESPAVQLYAIWTIHYVCSKFRKRINTKQL